MIQASSFTKLQQWTYRLVFALTISTIITMLFLSVYTNQFHMLRKMTPLHGDTKLLTLATTFSDSVEKRYIYRNAIINYGLLRPEIQPVLFSNKNNSLTRLALANGWDILPLHRTHKTLDLPYIKDMFFEIQEKYSSTFYGYTNGDILYDKTFTDTLRGVKEYKSRAPNILVTGRRINYRMRGENITRFEQVRNLSAKGKLFGLDAEDYFITTLYGYPWSILKDVVIGRPAFDNYVVAMGVKNNVTVIDATNTVRALHQSGRDGNFAGGHQKDPTVNKRIIGKFNYYHGLTSCAHWITGFDSIGRVHCSDNPHRCRM